MRLWSPHNSTHINVEWSPDLVPPAVHPRRRAAVLEHARGEVHRLTSIVGRRVMLHRHAYFRLADAAELAIVDSDTTVEVYGGTQRLASLQAADDSGREPFILQAAAWADDADRDARARFLLGTKAQTLARLMGKLTNAHTLPQLTVSRTRWRDDVDAVLAEVADLFAADGQVIIRSSAAGEDSWLESQAGAHDSVFGVDPTDKDAIATACDTVWLSYRFRSQADELLIQPALRAVLASGVITTREMHTKAPYYVIACDDRSGRTDTVTSGGAGNRTVYVARDAAAVEGAAEWVAPTVALAAELEELIGSDELDIEFAVTAEHGMVLLQVRRLAGRASGQRPDTGFAIGSHRARQAMNRTSQSASTLGTGVHLSAMSDWNPAELIGFRPQPLARSLYEYLITDEVWAQSRHRLGYRDLRGTPLMVDASGYAFIDVRASLSSLVPASLPDPLARRLVEHHLSVLNAQPHLHDKIEFDVAVTCLDFSWQRRATELRSAGFSTRDLDLLRSGLHRITQRAFGVPAHADGYFRRSAELSAGGDVGLAGAARKLAFVRGDGAVTFADTARAAFVAVSLLRTLSEAGIGDPHLNDAFMSSLHTVSNELVQDGHLVADGTLDWDGFVRRYRHLRPGTYDVESPTYGSDPRRFLGHFVRPRPAHVPQHATSPWAPSQRHLVVALMEELGFGLSPEELETFIRRSIELRERVKFDFTRHLSEVLETIADHYAPLGLNRETLAYLRIGDLWQPQHGWQTHGAELIAVAERRRSWYERTAYLRLPEYCAGTHQLNWFEVSAAVPNFVGRARVKAHIALVDSAGDLDPSGCVVVIEAADPGHDWIFGYPIAGLVTRYGGTNSHMAIRAAELSVPAAIGVGERIFAALRTAREIDLDCGGRRVMWL